MPNVHSVSVVQKAYYYYCENDQSLTHVYKPDRFEKLVTFQLHLEELCASDVYSDEVRYRIKRPFLDNLLACMKSEVNCVKEIGVKSGLVWVLVIVTHLHFHFYRVTFTELMETIIIGGLQINGHIWNAELVVLDCTCFSLLH